MKKRTVSAFSKEMMLRGLRLLVWLWVGLLWPPHASNSSEQVAEVGDLVQWEMDGALRLETSKRVRAIQEHGGQKWAFIEGSETGIPMNQVRVEQKGSQSPTPPPLLPEAPAAHTSAGEREWLRGPLSREASYRIFVSGGLGPKEIGKLIKLLQAQQAVLSDEDEDNDGNVSAD